MRISYQTDKERDIFDQEITLSSGALCNYRDILKKINCHKRGTFYNNTDSNDIFWSLGQPRAIDFASKMDVDTRHFMVEGQGDFNVYQAWACNIRFKKWSRDTSFATDLDDFGDASSEFGSCALKLTDKKGGGYDLNECDLMKIWFDPTIKDFYGQTKIELHELEEHQVLDKEGWVGKEKSWEKAITTDNIETEKSDETNQVAEKRKYWERVGYFDVSFYEKGDLVKGKYLMQKYKQVVGGKEQEGELDIRKVKKSDFKFMHVIFSGTGEGEVVVFAEEIKLEKDVYIDIHIGKYEDRWLRIGVYERLFPLQKMVNEIVNYDRESQQIASLLLMRTRNKRLVGSNILQDASSGLITDADLEQIGITNQFANEFVAKLGIYEQKADALCKTPDLKDIGDQKTFRGLAAMVNRANSAFKKSRDRICSKIGEVLVKRILPAEVKNWNKEKALEIAGFEIDVRMFDAIAVISKMNEWISNEHAKGSNPTEEEKRMFSEKLQTRFEREGRKMTLPEKFYDFDFGLAMNPTGESENKEQINDAYFNVITWVLANPAVNYIPAFREYCEKNGITPFHLTSEQVQQVQQGTTGQTGGAEPVTSGKKDKLSAAIDTNV